MDRRRSFDEMVHDGMRASTLGGRVTIVTGACGGIGTALSRLSAARGDRVYALDRTLTVASWPAGVRPVRVDVTDQIAVTAAVNDIACAEGKIDVLFNNAAIQGDKTPFLDLTLDSWRSAIEVNLTGAFITAQAVARIMASQGSGVIVNTISQLAYSVMPGYAPYAASKAGLAHLTHTMARELAGVGVRVVGVAPGIVASPMTAHLMADASWVKERLARIPSGRFASVEEIANFMLLVAGPDAEYIHGTTVVIDGGYLVGC